MKSQILGVLVLVTFMVFNGAAQTIENYSTTEGLPSNNVLCLVADGNNDMWFGTQNGVAKYDGNNWTYFTTTTHPELPHNTITAIEVDANDNVWVGTDNGVSYYDGTSWTTYTSADGLGNNRINYITVVDNGDVWFSEFSGATVFDGINFTAYGTADGLPFGGVNYIREDANNDIWMATGLSGLIKFDGTTFSSYTESDGLVSDVTRTLAIDNQDNKWVGTADGISVFDNSNSWVENHTMMLALPAPDTLNPVEDIQIDDQGNVWVGIYVDYLVTEGGVAKYDGTQWTDYDVSDGLVSPAVNKIALDNYGNLWVATNDGVSKFINSSMSIASNEGSSSFSVFPNPAKNKVVVQCNNLDSEIAVNSLKIYNTMLQLIDEVEVANSSVELNISNYKKGIYFMQLNGAAQQLVVID